MSIDKLLFLVMSIDRQPANLLRLATPFDRQFVLIYFSAVEDSNSH